jgi:hypothetical protein
MDYIPSSTLLLISSGEYRMLKEIQHLMILLENEGVEATEVYKRAISTLEGKQHA